MKSPTPRRLWKFVSQHLHLAAYFRFPGDGRKNHRIPAKDLLWSIVLGILLRQWAFLAIEDLVGSKARRNLEVSRRFGDDALGYFTARLDPATTRAALAAVLHRAKRNKAFEDCRFVGLALDGTTGGRRRKKGCPLCRPYRNTDREIVGYRHHFVLAAVVGGDLILPVDVEAYGPGDSEYAAGQRLLHRVRTNLGARFIDYVVVDGGFATAPFLHAAGKAGWPVVARLKENLPELSKAAERRFRSRPPDLEFRDGTDRVELWDADDFDPWESLQWETASSSSVYPSRWSPTPAETRGPASPYHVNFPHRLRERTGIAEQRKSRRENRVRPQRTLAAAFTRAKSRSSEFLYANFPKLLRIRA